MKDKGLILFAIVIWVISLGTVLDSIVGALLLTLAFMGVGLVYNVITKNAEDWLEGRESRVRREREAKLKDRYESFGDVDRKL